MSILHLLNKSSAVWRNTPVSDGQGGWTDTRSQVATLPVRVSPASASERLAAAQESARVTHNGYYEPGADVQRGDEWRIGSESYEVIATLPPSIAHHGKAQLEQIQPGVG